MTQNIKSIKRFFWFILIFLYTLLNTNHANAIVEDSRIRTLIYNQNEIYDIVTHTGYHSIIKFQPQESIENIILGNEFYWNIENLGDKILIRPMEPNLDTNMTIMTDKRNYYFEIASRSPTSGADSELVFIVNFYYPEINTPRLPKLNDTSLEYVTLSQNIQYNYVISGNKDTRFLPKMVFDDSKNTFIEFDFPQNMIQGINVWKNNSLQNVNFSFYKKHIILEGVYEKIILAIGGSNYEIINQSYVVHDQEFLNIQNNSGKLMFEYPKVPNNNNQANQLHQSNLNSNVEIITKKSKR